MARNMKMELHTFSPILYQSKKCGHRIHVLFMMYDVYWYCQMKKKRMIMKILKKEWFIWKFEKRGDSREKGGGGNEIHAPSACELTQLVVDQWDLQAPFLAWFLSWKIYSECTTLQGIIIVYFTMKNTKNLERKSSADRITCFLPLYYNPLGKPYTIIPWKNPCSGCTVWCRFVSFVQFLWCDLRSGSGQRT